VKAPFVGRRRVLLACGTAAVAATEKVSFVMKGGTIARRQ
jgi:hypothetical protein